jgi:copper(I)-binding protein
VNSKVSRRLVATAALAAGLGLFVAGCSAGQVTQTDTQVAAIDGASGNAGQIALRNAMLAYPHEGNRWKAGEEVQLTFVIANSGDSADKLLSISSPFATGEAEVEGTKDLPAFFALQAEADETSHGSSSVKPTSSSSGHASSTPSSTPSVTGTSTPSSTPSSSANGSSSVKPTSSAPSSSKAVSDLPVGKIKVKLKGLVQDVVAGQTVRVTFLFEKAGPLTLDVPVAPSTEERKSEGESGGH